jgi:predicted TIM-barrel fold metal-dependent hydrolase
LLNAPNDPKDEFLVPLVRAGAAYVDFAMVENVGAVAKLRDRVGGDRVLFGSHFPLFYLESALLKVREAGFSDAEAKAVLSTNARALLPAPRG